MNWQGKLLVVAIGALGVGVLVYVLDRQAEFVYFLPAWLSLHNQAGSLFGSIGDYLPTFIHVYVFILLTVVVAVPAISKLIPVCLAWFTPSTACLKSPSYTRLPNGSAATRLVGSAVSRFWKTRLIIFC